jgi:hypothetical protein
MRHLYDCRIYNTEREFADEYIVAAEDKNDAMKELIRRLDDETDDGSSAYDLLEMVEIE